MANLFSSMLPSSFYPESSDGPDSNSNSGHQLMPDVDSIASMMTYMYPGSTVQGQGRLHSTFSGLESPPLSDDEKRQRILLQEMIRTPDPTQWENDTIEPRTQDSRTNEPEGEQVTDPYSDDDWLFPTSSHEV